MVAALLFWLLQWGQPGRVSVVLALDLSNSTYTNGVLNGPGTVSAEAIQATKDYIDASSRLRVPNQVQVLGFGGAVVPLTPEFSQDRETLVQAIDEAVAPNAPTNVASRVMPNDTSISLAIKEGIQSLENAPVGCRELLVITDGNDELDSAQVSGAIASGIKLSFIVISQEPTNFTNAVAQSGGIYLVANAAGELSSLLVDRFFPKINSNLQWILLWLGAAWIALMWMLVLPLDRFLQKFGGIRFDHSGQIAMGHALFWSAATPGIVWKLLQILKLPFFSQC
ncbi:MAG: VWA domain-containing protein [Cyanophyceae cyanobacterium]